MCKTVKKGYIPFNQQFIYHLYWQSCDGKKVNKDNATATIMVPDWFCNQTINGYSFQVKFVV